MLSATDRPRVMVVEDEPRLRALMSEVIPEMGFDVCVCATAEIAVQLFEKEPADIMLMDLYLPGMDGMQLWQTIKTRRPQTQAVFMTAFGELETARRAMRLDAVDFLCKPSPLSEIELSLTRARDRLQRQSIEVAAPPLTANSESFTTLEAQQQQIIQQALARHNGNQSAAARELGISRRTVYNKLRENA